MSGALLQLCWADVGRATRARAGVAARGTGRCCWWGRWGPRRAGPPGPPGQPPTPGGRARRRICSNCARAAICWANSAVWMPWNRPSSQPTSWAWAIRSSASDGIASSVNGSEIRSSSSTSSGARPSSSSLIERVWISLSRTRLASSSSERAHLLEQLLDHAADPHHLGRLVDHLGDRALVHLVVAGRRPRPPSRPGPTTTTRGSAVVSPCSGPPDCCCSLMPPSSPTASAQNAWTPAAGRRQAGGMPTTDRDPPAPRPGRPRRRLRPDRGVRPRDRRASSTSPGTRSPPTWPRPPSRATGWYDGQGALVGYGWLRRIERTNQVEIDLYLRPSSDDGLGHTMLAQPRAPGRRACRRGGPRRTVGRRQHLPAGHPHPGLPAGRGLRQADHVHPDADRPRPGPAHRSSRRPT